MTKKLVINLQSGEECETTTKIWTFANPRTFGFPSRVSGKRRPPWYQATQKRRLTRKPSRLRDWWAWWTCVWKIPKGRIFQSSCLKWMKGILSTRDSLPKSWKRLNDQCYSRIKPCGHSTKHLMEISKC